MEAQSLVSHQHSWWFSCFSLREKLARSHNKKLQKKSVIFKVFSILQYVAWSLSQTMVYSN